MGSTKLTFGPPSSQWIYDIPSKTYDITRNQSTPPPLDIALTQGPPATTLRLQPATTTLVIVDMQNFFLHPSCRAHPTGLAAVDPLLRTIAACRATGVQVVWLNWGLTDADLAVMPAGVLRGFAKVMVSSDGKQAGGLGVDLGEGKGRCLVEGEWNSAIYVGLMRLLEERKKCECFSTDENIQNQGPLAEAVKEDDVHCAKNRMSGLWSESQPLWRYLESAEGKEKKTLLFAGVNTDQCVLGTLTNAYNAGWDCVMVEDCCATTTEGAREVCLSNIGVSTYLCRADPVYDEERFYLLIMSTSVCSTLFYDGPIRAGSLSEPHPANVSCTP